MIDALVTGRLAADPKSSTDKNGNTYATARVMVTAGGDERLSVSVITFDKSAVTALLALTSGDAVALAGEFTPRVWTDKDGKSQPSAHMKAHAVLTSYHVTRKHRAMQTTQGDD